MKRAPLVVAGLVAGLALIPLSSASATGHTLYVDGVGYTSTKETSGGTIHWETPDTNPLYAAFYERDQMWSPGDNGSDHLPCPYGIHWISNDNNLTISNCLPGPNQTTTTTTEVTTSTGPTTTSTTSTTTTSSTSTPTSTTSLPATTTTVPATTSSTSSPSTTSPSTTSPDTTTPTTTSPSPSTPTPTGPTTSSANSTSAPAPTTTAPASTSTSSVPATSGDTTTTTPVTNKPLPKTGSNGLLAVWALGLVALGSAALYARRRPD